MSFLNSIRWKPNQSAAPSDVKQRKEKEDAAPEKTPLERMLQNAGTVREDGSDKFFGMENFGNTCYCNSIVQALYYTVPFREHVLNFPPVTPADTPNDTKPRVNVQIRAPAVNGTAQGGINTNKPLSSAEAMARRRQINTGQMPPGQPLRPEDKPDTPEYKKKQAMLKGPILELALENKENFGMDESTFTALRDIFMALVDSNVRTGVLSPQRFLEIFKRDNEMFRTSMHQDAHEFYGLVLNDVISNVESAAQRLLQNGVAETDDAGSESLKAALGAIAKSGANGLNSPGTGWVHEIFEGLLVSETKCLTCETASRRDETFLDLSIDLEEHTSVTSCLQKFSAEEMLCERNKFHCDHCGGLQEAEKRMKIKRLPKVLALHLKRFKYTEDYSRLQKLFHRVVYPYELRMFNTTDEAEDPDRLYELYAVVVHIGGNAYHGHYVAVIKTEDRGWLLFDDEMVEPVDKHYVRNFFGDKPGMACAYVLFYQETTWEKVRAEQEAEGLEEVRIASEKADLAQENGQANGTASTKAQPAQTDDSDGLTKLEHASTAPGMVGSPTSPSATPHQLDGTAPPVPPVPSAIKPSKEDKKEAKAAEKARKLAEKEEIKNKEKQRKDNEARIREARRVEQENLRKVLEESRKTFEEEDTKRHSTTDPSSPGLLTRANTGGKSMARKSFGFLAKDKLKRDSTDVPRAISEHPDSKPPSTPTHSIPAAGSRLNGEGSRAVSASVSHDPPPPEHHKPKRSFTFGLGRKKSKNAL